MLSHLAYSFLLIGFIISSAAQDEEKGKYLNTFAAYPGKIILIPTKRAFQNVVTAEECAKNCRTAEDITCKGFNFCQNLKTCFLFTKHLSDLNSKEVMTVTQKLSCTHFAAKYSADFLDLGHTLLDDSMVEKTEINLEDCAKACSEEFKDKCQSFNYCPGSPLYRTDSSCTLSSFTLKSTGAKATTNPSCNHYERLS